MVNLSWIAQSLNSLDWLLCYANSKRLMSFADVIMPPHEPLLDPHSDLGGPRVKPPVIVNRFDALVNK